VRPAGATAPLPGVIFLHGWGLVRRADYRPWIRHLARAGNEVIVPRYQRDESSDPGRALADALAGIRAALRRAPIADGSLVVAGHSAGAALAADYAAVSAQRGLPVPVGVYAVYPGRRILGYPAGIPQVDPAEIGARTELTAMAGSTDIVVGQAPAQELVADATAVPAPRKRYVLVQRAGVADHYGPTRATRSARDVFWARLDRLIRRARSD
jgi:acetyl esterase/lipase